MGERGSALGVFVGVPISSKDPRMKRGRFWSSLPVVGLALEWNQGFLRLESPPRLPTRGCGGRIRSRLRGASALPLR